MENYLQAMLRANQVAQMALEVRQQPQDRSFDPKQTAFLHFDRPVHKAEKKLLPEKIL